MAYDRAALIPDLMRHISQGGSVHSWCEPEGRPDLATVWRWLEDPDIRDEYTRARTLRGEYYGARVAEIGERAMRGEIASDAARVAVDALKWTAARMAPKQWGDRIQAEVSGPGGGPVEITLPVSLMMGDRGRQDGGSTPAS